MKKEQLILINDLLLKFQRKRRFVALSHGIRGDQAGEGLSYAEEAILMLLQASPGMNIRDLALKLKLERSWMSRVTTELERRKLIKSHVPDNDKRSKNFFNTDSGLQTLKKLNLIVLNIMNESLSVLDDSQQKKLALLLHKLADGMGAEKAPEYESSKLTSGFHPVDTALARISRVTGVVGEDVFGSGLSVTKLQVLFVLNDAENPLSLIQIAELLPFDFSTISRVISDYEKFKWVSKKQSAQDKRVQAVVLTKAGSKKIYDYYELATEAISKAAGSLKSNETEELIKILEILTAQNIMIRQYGKGDLEIRQIAAIADDGQIYQRKNKASTGSTVYGIYKDSVQIGYLDLEKSEVAASGQSIYSKIEIRASEIELRKLADILSRLSR